MVARVLARPVGPNRSILGPARWAHVRASLAAFLFLAPACGAKAVPPALGTEARTPAQVPEVVDAAVAVAADGAGVDGATYAGAITSPCVPHAGESQSKRHRVTMRDGGTMVESAHGSCRYDAECTRESGRSAEGDGVVSVFCDESQCSCVIEPFHGRKIVEPFALDQPCTDAKTAKRLLVERCMKNLSVSK